MENYCFLTSASPLIKRIIVRIQRQKFGYCALYSGYYANFDYYENILRLFQKKLFVGIY